MKRKTLQPAAVPRTLNQTGSLTGLVLAWPRKFRNVPIILQDSLLIFSLNFAFCAMFLSLRQTMFSGRLTAVRKMWRKQIPPPLRTEIIYIEYTLQFYDMLYYLYWDKNKSMQWKKSDCFPAHRCSSLRDTKHSVHRYIFSFIFNAVVVSVTAALQWVRLAFIVQNTVEWVYHRALTPAVTSDGVHLSVLSLLIYDCMSAKSSRLQFWGSDIITCHRLLVLETPETLTLLYLHLRLTQRCFQQAGPETGSSWRSPGPPNKTPPPSISVYSTS